jgi:hypothetical protein
VNPTVIVVPNQDVLRIPAVDHGDGARQTNDGPLSLVTKQLQDVGRSSGLKSFEIICDAILSDEEWSPENVRESCFTVILLVCVDVPLGLLNSCRSFRGEDIHSLHERDRSCLREMIQVLS